MPPTGGEPSLGEVLLVDGLHGLEQALGRLLPADEVLELRRPATGPGRSSPVALAMKSMIPFSAATTCAAASVSFVMEPSAAGGMVRSAGPIGAEPDLVTLMARASGLVPTQSRKNAAQSGFLALAAIPNVTGTPIDPCVPPSVAGGNRKNPTSSGLPSYVGFCQVPLNVKTPSPPAKRCAAWAYPMALTSSGK